MTADLLSLVVGAALSLLFSYVPGFKTWFAQKATEQKRLIMAGLLFLLSAAIFAASCANLALPGVAITCDVDGAWGLVQVYILALVANQGTFVLTKG